LNPLELSYNNPTMTTAFTIPFNEILEKAFQLRDQKPDISIDDMMKEILPTIHIKFQSDVPMTLRKKTVKDETSDKKKELTMDERCMARTIYEKDHLESNGLLKLMRDDPKNQYGDRCKCRKKDSGLFCTRHSGWQSLGVWNGEYSGKFYDYVQKTQNGSVCQIVDDDEPPKPVAKPPQKKKEVKETVVKEKMVKPASAGDASLSVKPGSTGEPNFSVKPSTAVDSGQTKGVKPASAGDACLSVNVKPALVVAASIHTDEAEEEQVESDEDSVMAYPVQIDGVEYNIDDRNNVYTDDGELVGVYNRLKKSWLSKI